MAVTYTPPVFPALWYGGFAIQSAWGTAVAPVFFPRQASASKGEETIKTEEVYDGLNRDPSAVAKVLQYHEYAFGTQLYPNEIAAILFTMLGMVDTTTGSSPTNTTTLSAGVSAGATSLPVTAITGYVTGQTVQVGTVLNPEIVTIGVPSGGNLPITSPTTGVRFAHASSVSVSTVVAPFVHNGSSTNAIPAPISFEHSVGQAPSPATPLEVFRTVDGVWSDFKIESQGAKLAAITAAIMGTVSTPGTTPAVVAFTTNRPASHADLAPTFTAYVATPGSGLDLAAAANLTGFSYNAKLTLDTVAGAGGLAPVMQLAGVRAGAITFDVAIGDNKLLREIYYGSPSSTTAITALQTSQLVMKWDLAGSPDYYLQCTFPNVSAETAKPTYDNKGKAEILKVTGVARTVGASPVCSVVASTEYAGSYSL